tara:strand:+ start:103 stop:522 length:420 start_codon:yes stop_codon:yes gene_type:complete
MTKATKETVVYSLSKKSKMALSYSIAGFYSDENLIGSKNWHSLMWAIFGQIGKTFSNDPSDPRPNFTSVDNTRIREFEELSDFEAAYPAIAKIAKAKADLYNSPNHAAPAEQPREQDSDLSNRMDKIENALATLLTKLQ